MSLSCWTRRLMAAALFAGACSVDPTAPGRPPAELTALPRALTAAEQKVIDASNAFSFALWTRLNAAQPGTSIFVSPLSASFSLGMTLNGAANQTATEMRAALAFGGASQQEINEGYRSLIALLMSLDPAVTMQIANSIWYRNTFPFHQAFLDGSRTYFDAEVRGLNFADVPGSLAAINGWANAKTSSRIPSILTAIGDDDVMFLINAIYFNGRWRERFDPAETRDTLFYGSGGSAQSVRMMHHRGTMPYAWAPMYEAVDLLYGNAAFSMTVVLPRPGANVETLAASMTPETWRALTSSLQATEVDLSLPRLQFVYERKLNADLDSLGMHLPFVPWMADFTGMSPLGRDLYISFVKQKTFVKIDEEGTEAAAVTVTGVTRTVSSGTATIRVDRPYLFVLRERLSGTVLFMGKIVRMP